MRQVGIAQIADPALRTNAKLVGLKLGISFPDADGSIDNLSWSDLHERKKELMRFARGLTDKLEQENRAPDGAEERAIQYAMDFSSYINLELDHRSESGKLGPRPGRLRGDREPFASEWHTKDGAPVPVLTCEQRVADHVGAGARSGGDGDLRLGRMILALKLGAKEAGLSDAEQRALSEGTDASGGFTVNPVLSAQLIDRARPLMRVVEAGAVTIPFEAKELKIARISADPTIAWHTENAAESATDPTFE